MSEEMMIRGLVRVVCSMSIWCLSSGTLPTDGRAVMARFLVGYVVKGAVDEYTSIEATDLEDLIHQLNNWHPGTSLEGHGFTYITNGAHWAAASYSDDMFVHDYRRIRAPAHINPPFFHILRSVVSSTAATTTTTEPI